MTTEQTFQSLDETRLSKASLTMAQELFVYAFRMLSKITNKCEHHKMKRRPQPSDFHILNTHGEA